MKLSRKQKNEINKIAKKRKLKLIIAFGSYVTGKIHPESDIDIAILPEKRNFELFKIFSYLQEDFENVFPGMKTDISFINRADPLLLSKICEDSFLLYGNLREYRELKLYSFKRYNDYLPYFEIEKEFVNNFIGRFGNAGR